jgi:hypothetical protein
MTVRSYACDNGDCHLCTGRGYGGGGWQGPCEHNCHTTDPIKKETTP